MYIFDVLGRYFFFFHIGRRLIECSDSKLLNERRTRERSPKSTTPGARDLMRAEILCIASFSCEINQRGALFARRAGYGLLYTS
ncbi:hypothetical protein EVAR_63196_1 [Eumeta japonica]|uniref:Uncharacterized protein n=1 Tax=Eumeta variegata TaxID=151549 RepID=A0A4C1ZVB3_EUMVA|nr:hypothetical protein EVAR_63196_1 [Eumeta japonica]